MGVGVGFFGWGGVGLGGNLGCKVGFFKSPLVGGGGGLRDCLV